MDYPQRFFSKMFKEARGLELARRFAVLSSALLFLIACAAGAIVWAHRSESARPYFLYVDRASGEWMVYSQKVGAANSESPWYRMLQESMAVNFASGYLRISDSLAENGDVLWCRCGGDCDANWGRCKLCCASDSKTFERFYADVLPDWRRRFGAGEFMEPVDVSAAPIGEVAEHGGMWRITGVLISNRARARQFVAFMKLGRNRGAHAETLGYYVSEFDFYVVEN